MEIDALFPLFDDDKTEPQIKRKKSQNISPHKGHRQRLQARFVKSGFSAFHDYEIIELILFTALLAQWPQLCDFLRLKMAHLTHEEFYIFFLDAKSYLLNEMKLFRGTIDETAIYPREIIKHAIECGAMSFVIAHNHPSGHTTPSQADIKMTYDIIKSAELMKITLIDHIIVGKYEITSFKKLNLL